MIKLWIRSTCLLLTHLIFLPPPQTWYTNSWQHGQICGAQNALCNNCVLLLTGKRRERKWELKWKCTPLLHVNTPWLCHKFSAHLRQVSKQLVVWNEFSNSQFTWDQGNQSNTEKRQDRNVKKNYYYFVLTECYWPFLQIIIIWKHPF